MLVCEGYLFEWFVKVYLCFKMLYCVIFVGGVVGIVVIYSDELI